MKRLPQFYLANFMGLERDRRRIAIRRFCETEAGRWGYYAFSQCTNEILGAESGLFGKLAPVLREKFCDGSAINNAKTCGAPAR